jgi:hypothetical protein
MPSTTASNASSWRWPSCNQAWCMTRNASSFRSRTRPQEDALPMSRRGGGEAGDCGSTLVDGCNEVGRAVKGCWQRWQRRGRPTCSSATLQGVWQWGQWTRRGTIIVLAIGNTEPRQSFATGTAGHTGSGPNHNLAFEGQVILASTMAASRSECKGLIVAKNIVSCSRADYPGASPTSGRWERAYSGS